MPIIKSAIKRMKQTAKRRERNVATKRDIKSAVNVKVLAALHQMREEGQQVGIVVDEYGGTDGLVALEDLLEEVVGLLTAVELYLKKDHAAERREQDAGQQLGQHHQAEREALPLVAVHHLGDQARQGQQ